MSGSLGNGTSSATAVSNATIVTNVGYTPTRQFISLLPSVNQTDTLARFFGSTVDQVFQPGSFQSIDAYIGEYPIYYNSTTDFYVLEPDYTRQNYQLEAGMISANTAGSYVYSLCYPDLVGYFSAQGSDTTNQSKMFETSNYSWCPPIDIDKLVNFNNYYWFGDYDSTEIPTLTLTSPVLTYKGDGSTKTFLLPDLDPGIANSISNAQMTVVAYVDHVKIANTTYSGNTITLPEAPVWESNIVVTRFDDLTIAIQNSVTFSLSGFIENAIVASSLTSGMCVYLQDTSRIFAGYSGDYVFSSSYEFLQNFSGDLFDPVPYAKFIVDGVGQSIRLTPTDLLKNEIAPQYSLIDRSSYDQNPWSLSNNWVHKDSFAWSGQSFPAFDSNGRALRGQRPIIEFIRDIKLYDYGYNRIASIDGILSTANAVVIGGEPITASEISGQYMNDVVVDGNVKIFPGMRLLIAQPLLGSTSPNQQLYMVNGINGVGIWDEFPWGESEFDIPNYQTIQLVPLPQNAGDVATVNHTSGYGPSGSEMYFDGTNWKLAQSWAENKDPLFDLYDIEGVELTDTSKYINSTFSGSRIFGYASGSGTNDVVLLRPLQYDNNGYIVFEDDVVTRRAYTVINGVETEITGLYCYAQINYNTSPVTFPPTSLWHPSPGPTIQDVATLLADGTPLFNIPTNLQANPSSEEVDYISTSDWVYHFQEVISNQMNFSGNALAANNWRDTLRDLNLGAEILQHVAPMLKVMLLADEPKIDMLASIRYIDLQYNLFRNQFSRKMTQFENAGTLLPAGPTSNSISLSYSGWTTAILNNLKVNRNSSFPFFLSTMAANSITDNFFIPATPTFLGVLPSYNPEIILDNTYPTPVTMIRGHDGSLTLSFGDWRDNVLLDLEQRIYDSIPTQYVNLERPLFDIEYYIAGRFCPANVGAFATSDTSYTGVSYTRGQIQSILAPIFERWAQISRLDYRTNSIYDPTNPFTWNYRGLPDRFGDLLPGNWRAIYRWYYDTDHPHTAPWEMLGFTKMPSWWVAQYGAAPYTSANTALWGDLEAGMIRSGPRAGINLRYARPGLSNVIPVDINGNLLDPINAGIVFVNTTLTTTTSTSISNSGVSPPMHVDTLSYGGRPLRDLASRNWVAGDGGPAENIWITSSSYRYTLAQIAFMTKPARFVEMNWDNINYGFQSGQWIDFRTNQRPSNANNYVHGELGADGVTLTTVYGIQQWISDYLKSAALPATILGNAVRGLDVRLINRAAGFMSSSDLSVVTDNFGIIPSEDVKVFFYETPSSDTEVYSGVIVEWVGTGWRVIGYDARNPVFSVIPPDVNGPKTVITLATTPEPVIHNWLPNTYYRKDQQVIYANIYYSALITHVSGAKFDLTYWQQTTVSSPKAPRVISYANGVQNNRVISIPYGTEFYSTQQVADFLLSYERWLISRGWTFTVLASDGTIRNWTKSVVDFLTWTQVNWAPGNFIALSPGAEELHFETETGTTLNIEDSTTGFYGLLDRSGNPIHERDVLISRLDSDLKIVGKNADIFAARVRVVEIEHAIIFNNITVFNDAIYLPIFNMRQPRLKILGNKTTNWAGRLEAPGFIISGNDVLPNFDRNVEDIRLMFDVELSLRSDFTEFARHNIGYQARSYMEDLLLSEVEQFEFYQGMIQQKGAPDVFNKLLRSSRITGGSDIEFLEEFAIRTSRFGGPVDPRVTFTLQQANVVNNPQFIYFGTLPVYPEVDPTWIIMSANDSRWIDNPFSRNVIESETWDENALDSEGWDLNNPPPPTPFFPVLPPPDPNNIVPNKVISAGPVRTSDVDYSLFYTYYLEEVYSNATANAAGVAIFTTGERVWIYEDSENLSWNVYEIFELGVQPNYISYTTTKTEDPSVQGMRLYFEYPHGLSTADAGKNIVVDGLAYTTPEIRGIQEIELVNSVGNWIQISIGATAGFNFANASTYQFPPNVRIFDSVRFANTNALLASKMNYQSGDLAWIDQDSNFNNVWTVRQFSGSGWWPIRIQPTRVDPSAITESMVYDISTEIDNQSRTITKNNPILNDLVIVDPLAGMFPGAATEEIDFQTAYDPANYSSSLVDVISPDAWGDEHVGRVWWDISTVRYLEPYTDRIGVTPERDIAEINYRIATWATIADNTSVDVYEWTKSPVDPLTYAAGTYAGTVYDATQPSYSTESIWSPAFNKFITYYYFWVSGLTTTPNVSFRKSSVSAVAAILESPTGQDIPWFAPIMQDGVIVSGVQPYLNDTSTVLKIETTNNTDDKGHSQWLLMRPGDETSLPEDWLWRKLVDSLGGFDSSVHVLPNPDLSPYRSTGIYDGQNMFVIDQNTTGDRLGLLAARQSFVGIVNNILAQTPVVLDRPAGILTLSRSTPISPELFWSRIDDSYIIEPPPVNEYDYVVYSLEERNRLVIRQDFQSAITTNKTLRVLIDGTMLPTPQWSIWWFNPSIANTVLSINDSEIQPLSTIDALYNSANTIFTLGTSYDVTVATYADRNALTGLTTGTRVYVEQDETTNINTSDAFWTIYRYDPTNTNADSAGFTLDRIQTYRTSDFYTQSDWYYQSFDTGYQTITFSPINPPQVTYSSTSARDAAEGTTNPANVFVKIQPILSSGALDNWYWQYWTPTTGWTTVANQSGTIQLSSNFYNSNLDVHAVTSLETSTVANRDGSWEIKVLADSLRRGGLLLNSEINTIFFSMLHFVHSQQDDVDWVFKTSFMVIAGYSIPLLQTGILTEDISNSLISYVEEVKPYHVKVRDYIAQYEAPMETINVHVEELIRDLNVKIAFDRVSDIGLEETWDGGEWDVIGWDGNESGANTAADRIDTYYTPTTGMPPATPVSDLINVLYRYPVIPINGNFVSNSYYYLDYEGIITTNVVNTTVSINPNDIFSGNDPAYGRWDTNRAFSNTFVNRSSPEERVSGTSDDGLVMTITSLGSPGSPLQKSRVYNNQYYNYSDLLTFDIGQLPQSAAGVFVYLDGIRANYSIDYTIDYLNQTISILLGANSTQIHSFGFGGTGGIIEQHFISYSDSALLTQGNYVANNVQIIADGVLLNSTDFTVGDGITLTTTLSNNADVAILIWDSPVENTCQVQTQNLILSNSNTYTLLYPDLETIPPHAGTIVEINGERLSPPATYYGNLTPKNRIIVVDLEAPANTPVDLYIDGTYYPNIMIPSSAVGYYDTGYPFNVEPIAWETDINAWETNPWDITTPFVRYDRYIICVNPTLMAKDVVIVFYDQTLFQYTVTGNAITFNTDTAPLTSAVSATITTFTNSHLMGIRTHSSWSHVDGGYIISEPPSKQASLVSFDGKTLVPESDYDFGRTYANRNPTQVPIDVVSIPLDPKRNGIVDDSWDDIAWDINKWDGPSYGNKRIVATVFMGSTARLPSSWKASTTTPTKLRMEPALVTGGFDEAAFDAFEQFDMGFVQEYNYARFGSNTNPVPVFNMDQRWEYSTQSIYNTGTLVTDFAADASNITISPNFGNVSTKLWPIQLGNAVDSSVWEWVGTTFALPDQANNKPGVVWVGGERIEYMSLTYDPPSFTSVPTTLTPPNVILSNLRRGTRGTSPQNENRVSSVTICDGLTNEFDLNGIGSLDIQVYRGNSSLSAWNTYFVNIQTVNNTINSTFNCNTVDHYYPAIGNDLILTTNTTTNVTSVVLKEFPPSGAYVGVGITIPGAAHPAGTFVADGTQVFSIENMLIDKALDIGLTEGVLG